MIASAGKMNLLELYCGVGSHTVVLAPFFNQIVAVEINPRLVEKLRMNMKLNGIEDKVTSICADSGKFCMKILAKRAYGNIRFDWILVDPPRAGLDKATIELVK